MVIVKMFYLISFAYIFKQFPDGIQSLINIFFSFHIYLLKKTVPVFLYIKVSSHKPNNMTEAYHVFLVRSPPLRHSAP